jgi:hypothetical protein
MTLLPPGVKVHLAFGYTDMRMGIDGLAMLVQGVLRQDPFSGHLFRVPGSEGRPDQDRILGWDRPLPLHQAARARRLPVAIERRGVNLGTVIDADRRCRLARSRAAVATRSGGMIAAAD